MGHYKRNCPKTKFKSNYNHNLSHIICKICKKPGHHATTCPHCKDRDNKNLSKSVTFESAHLVNETEEHCKTCLALESNKAQKEKEELYFIITAGDQEKDEPDNNYKVSQIEKLANLSLHQPYEDLSSWLLDSGATSHFTLYLCDLQQPEQLRPPISIKVADGL